jgi:hypothetical protein
MKQKPTGVKKIIDVEKFIQLRDEYCDHCINDTKEVPSVKGVVQIKDRHLPTIEYFLLHWLRMKQFDFYKKTKWYDALKNPQHDYHDVVVETDAIFRALARDVVANEGKGIFYAKNFLGMTDRLDTTNTHTISEIKITYDS